MSHDCIKIVGARQHNLKNIDVSIPRNKLVVVTGVSGSGKSSLAFNTLYAEGQRRYVESLSSYARQFIDQLEKPEVDFIEGLSPAIAIQQRTSNPNPRSTTATSTEIYDYLRILFAAVGQPHDPSSGVPLRKTSPQDIVDVLLENPPDTKAIVLAPNLPLVEGDPRSTIELMLKQGFVRARIGGEIVDLEESLDLKGGADGQIDAVVDRLTLRKGVRSRVYEAIETALRITTPRVDVLVQAPGASDWEAMKFSTTFSNPETGFTMPELTPKHFSFNSHLGACPRCHGLGNELVCDPSLLVPDPSKSLDEGALKSWWSRNKKLKAVQDRQIDALARHYEVERGDPFSDLPEPFADALFRGTGEVAIKSGWKTGKNTRGLSKPFEGLATQAERLYATSKSEITRRNVRRFLNPRPCGACRGKRLKAEMLTVTISNGTGDQLNIQEVTALSFETARSWIDSMSFEGSQREIADPLLEELRKRLDFLVEVGLGYLTLDRMMSSLSGGEAQRIRLATQLGSALAGVLYVLDEPTIGLHPSDNSRLIATLKNLRDLGNSVVVVEHDADTIRAGDHLIEMGPGAGPDGGRIIAQGTAAEFCRNEACLTGAYLSGKRRVAPPPRRILPVRSERGAASEGSDTLDTGWITIRGASENNLANLDVSIPLGCFVCVAGVSGSGKSTLVDTVLKRALTRKISGTGELPGAHKEILGLQQIDKTVVIDQSPLGRSPRSNPVTYLGAFAPIRELFSQVPAARARGYTPGRFSFNVAGGRCDSCSGSGSIAIDMHFLNDVYVTCESCGGTRYQREILDITFKGRSIADVLDMTVSEAASFFAAVPAVSRKLLALEEVGLGYVKLGQPGTTLSGGEAQRVKLAAELSRKATGRTLYLLDEPTTGLHFADVDTLLQVFYRLRDAGSTLLVIEHNMDVVKCADWVIELGPGGGPHGGCLVAEGPPGDIANSSTSLSAPFLRDRDRDPAGKT